MKKILEFVLAFCMVLPFAVSAETIEVSTANISGSTYNVYIEGESDATSVSVMLRGETATDVAYINEVTPDISNNGKYVVKFKFNGDIDNYGVYVRDTITGEEISETVKKAVATDELYTASINLAVDATGRAYIEEGDALNVTVDIENKYGDDATMEVLVAAYGEKNKLLDVKSTNVTTLYEELSSTKTADFSSFNVPADTVKVKVFVWNNAETMIPVGPSKMAVSEDKAVTVHVAGDSLATNYVQQEYPQMGWAQHIGEYFADGVEINNAAIGGWSSFGFLYAAKYDENGVRLEGQKGSAYKNYDTSAWNQKIIQQSKPGDYVIISFGINDLMQTSRDVFVSPDGTRYVKASLNGETRYAPVNDDYNDEAGTATINDDTSTWLTANEGKNFERIYSFLTLAPGEKEPTAEHYRTYYKDNLTTMVQTAKNNGLIPILLSSTGHYTPSAIGDPVLSDQKLDDYFVYMKEVAEAEDVTFIDLFSYTDALYKQWGNQTRMNTVQLNMEAINWFKKYDPDHLSNMVYNQYVANPSKVDQVHYNANGAKWVASLIAKLIYESDSSLSELIDEPDVYDIPMIIDETDIANFQ